MDELVEYLSISKRSIYHLISERELPFIPLSKRLYRFDRTAIDKWMVKRQIQALDNHLETIEI
ncbi:MAG: excisionase family DNA-binding protein [Elusimicrobia bacterium]|nr:excisionase family DNA-binding protein [Elusimicrobiota bacterium]